MFWFDSVSEQKKTISFSLFLQEINKARNKVKPEVIAHAHMFWLINF